MAYGQMLQIERGILSFNGPADNPGLNIRAMRTNKSASASIDIAENISPPVNGSSSSSAASSGSDYQVVSAGVEISGSAFQPKVKLVSEPNVSDTEKLSWLILGHGIDQVGGKQFSMLPLAVNALLTEGKSVPIQTQLANFTGLDEISVSGEDVESIELTVGKRLTSQLYISYAKSMNGLLNLARLTFYITPRWAIQAETGTESAVDALYTFSFE
jgi:translocation and assembly module TamB